MKKTKFIVIVIVIVIILVLAGYFVYLQLKSTGPTAPIVQPTKPLTPEEMIELLTVSEGKINQKELERLQNLLSVPPPETRITTITEVSKIIEKLSMPLQQ